MTSEELQKLLDEAPLPGWQVQPSVPESGFECYWVYDADHREIGAVNGPHNAERAAIAALWAAAPDLAAELIRVRQGRDELREVAKRNLAWLERWASHVATCKGGYLCSCGLTAMQHETRAALAKWGA